MFSEAARKRLIQLIPRLASDQDGEVLGAVVAIRRVLATEGRDLHDLANAATAEPTKPPKSDWLARAEACAAMSDYLSDREAEFVADMAVKLRYQPEPTEKQAAWLASIYEKLNRQYGAAS